ncbi:MAG: endonuclease IV [Elusimicrobia bacterium ADurb.Bin231]|nr:MAG: endonuclease IV [Elusimicrobia bacterium ADurb.Bin231]
MKIGRDFTNLLNTAFLTETERTELKKGSITVADMDAKVQSAAKRDIVNQVKVASEVSLDHVELDGGIPNPYLGMSAEEIKIARSAAEKNNISLSFHLPYTYLGAAVCAFQKEDREYAVKLMKRYMDLAASLGCNNLVMHPGSVPFYQAVGLYRVMVKENLVNSLKELISYSHSKGMLFHLENNTAFDFILVEIEECLEILEIVEPSGERAKFCFDIGHWFTRADCGKTVPEPPEDIMKQIPEKYISQVHLNDYIPVVKKFHPPLHYQAGLLKRDNLSNLFKIFKQKKVDTIVMETAVRDVDELLNTRDLMKKEAEYVREIMG